MHSNTYYPSKVVVVALLATSLAIVSGSIWTWVTQNAGGLMWLPMIVCSVASVLFTLALFPRAAFLTIDMDGFTFVSYFTVARFSWREVDCFRVGKQAGKRTVFFDYLCADNREWAFTRRVVTLPYTMGFSPVEIARLLCDGKEEYRQSA